MISNQIELSFSRLHSPFISYPFALIKRAVTEIKGIRYLEKLFSSCSIIQNRNYDLSLIYFCRYGTTVCHCCHKCHN